VGTLALNAASIATGADETAAVDYTALAAQPPRVAA
jgi:hypothetical protein